MKVETVEEYLARGGKIKRYRSRADEIAARQIPTGKYVQWDAYYEVLRGIKEENRLRKAEKIRKACVSFEIKRREKKGGRFVWGRD